MMIKYFNHSRKYLVRVSYRVSLSVTVNSPQSGWNIFVQG
jgi:hypothetical protein